MCWTQTWEELQKDLAVQIQSRPFKFNSEFLPEKLIYRLDEFGPQGRFSQCDLLQTDMTFQIISNVISNAVSNWKRTGL